MYPRRLTELCHDTDSSCCIPRELVDFNNGDNKTYYYCCTVVCARTHRKYSIVLQSFTLPLFCLLSSIPARCPSIVRKRTPIPGTSCFEVLRIIVHSYLLSLHETCGENYSIFLCTHRYNACPYTAYLEDVGI